MEQIDKVKGIIKFKLQYKNGNPHFYDIICDILKAESYEEEMYTQNLDTVRNLNIILGETKPLLAVRSQDDYLIVKDFKKISTEISLYIVWQSNKDFAQVCYESVERINDLISEKWINSEREKSKLVQFEIPDSPNITIYPAYINGKKVESDSGTTIENILVEKTNSVDKKEWIVNSIGILVTLLIFGFQQKWLDLVSAIVPMGCIIIYNLWKLNDKKNYKTIIKHFNILESTDDTISSVEPTTDNLTIPDIDLKLEGDENV